jgi:hypothetical protein
VFVLRVSTPAGWAGGGVWAGQGGSRWGDPSERVDLAGGEKCLGSGAGRPLPERRFGTTTLAVERATGDLLSFASGIPPNRVEEAFDDVRPHARVVAQGSD